MLAGEHAADFDAQPQNVGAELFRALQFARLIGIVQDQRMQIAVAGVKHIGDASAVFRRQFLHARRRAAAWRAGWCRPCSNNPGEMRPTAGNAALRPAQNSSRSSSELEIGNVAARQSREFASTRSTDGRPRRAGRRARRSTSPRRRADSRHERSPPPPGWPARPSSPCPRE